MLRDKSILLISPERWDHIFVSKHHYAVHLGQRNNKVFFLNPPGTSASVVPTEYENVISVNYTGFPRGLRFYPRRLIQYFVSKRFKELEKLCNTAFDIIWSFDNSVFFDLSAVPQSVLTISHIVDATQDFETGRAAATATLCLGSTRFIVDRLKRSNPNSFFIQHGYARRDNNLPLELPGRYAIRAGYAGNLNLQYIDWQLVDEISTNHPEVGFYFAGPYRPDHESVRALKEKTNTHFLGELPTSQLDAFYRQMDVLLLCYRADDYPDQLANPHKMIEYLGSGKVVVATMTDEHKGLAEQSLIVMSERNAQYAECFRKTLQEIDFWNGQEKRSIRRQFALDNSYDKQIDRIESLLNKVTGKVSKA